MTEHQARLAQYEAEHKQEMSAVRGVAVVWPGVRRGR